MKALVDRIVSWLVGPWSQRELGRMSEAEVDFIARDTGVSVAELYDLARRGPAAASQLPRRMAALHIDAGQVAHDEPQVLRDLQRVCAVCGSKSRCERDLNRNASDPTWESYCPNAGTLRALQ